MRHAFIHRSSHILAGSAATLVLLWLSMPAAAPSSAIAAQTLSFLQPGRCYRLTFPITGAPVWKVLEVLEAGWIRAEVDAGAASARREAAWINTAQIITVREARCSGD